ncbi:MAG: hypothetical protein HDR04_17490 [Lachnospiraceae bacterium]|nr:hypothetical protein [Lachnospiraceae bacterium]
MKLKNFEVREIGFGEDVLISLFIEDRHIFYSEKNSKGKTTLVRFLIFSLGFSIPSTKKVDMKKYVTYLTLESDDNRELYLIRKNDEFKISYEDGVSLNYDLGTKMEQYNALSMVFQCNNLNLLENILPIFYIDQDKGWRLVNRGAVIGDNSFNIENFILALDDNVEEDIAAEIKVLKNEVERYEAIQCLMAYEIDVNENKDIYNQSDIVEELLAQKGAKRFEIINIENEISELQSIFEDNNKLLEFVEKYNILICYEDKEFVLARKHIKDFTINQNILRARVNSLEIEKKIRVRELAEINRKISEANVLVKPEQIEDMVAHEIHNLPITGEKLEDYIEQKKKQLKEIKKLRKEIVRDSNSEIADDIAKNIRIIAEKMEVYDIVSVEKDYIFTRNIKALSGAILHKVSLTYKIAYLKAIDKYIGIKLPIIIDSPCSGEVTYDNANAMIKIVMEELPCHQIIVASVHDFSKLEFARTKLVEGVFGEYITD